jgi:hypothetical protein
VQHEGIRIHAELGHDERDPLGHEPGNESDVARETVELGHNDGALACAPCSQGSGKLWPPLECVRSLAGFDLDELGGQLEALSLGEALDGSLLGFDAVKGSGRRVVRRSGAWPLALAQLGQFRPMRTVRSVSASALRKPCT